MGGHGQSGTAMPSPQGSNCYSRCIIAVGAAENSLKLVGNRCKPFETLWETSRNLVETVFWCGGAHKPTTSMPRAITAPAPGNPKNEIRNPLRIRVELFDLLYVWHRHFLARFSFLMILGALENRHSGLSYESKNIQNE